MKKMGRALALLLTLAMLFTTCGFAEDVEAVDFAPEAIEATEQPAESAEEPAEEPIAEEVAEESVEEPVEEAPAEPVEEEPVEEDPEISVEMQDFGYIEKSNSCTAVESDGGHSFQNGKCTACGYKCPHGRVDTMYALNIVTDHGVEVIENDATPVFAPIDGEKHLVKMRYRYVVTQCRDCMKIIKKTKLKKETSYTVEAPHDFGDAEHLSGSCYLCGYVKDENCPHDNCTTVEHEVIDGYEPIDGVKHLVKGTKYKNAQKCLDCGAISFDPAEGEEFTREEPHMKRQFEQGYDYNYGYGYVWWDEGGDDSFETPYDIEIHCPCGYTFDATSENYDHEHKWVDCKEEWNERFEVIANDYENHNRVVDNFAGKMCSVCGIHLEMKKTDETATPEPHVWDSGFCTVCGMSQMCAHPEEVLDGIYTANELKQQGLLDDAAPDTFTSLDEQRHMVSAMLYRLYVCAYCREPLRCEFADSEYVRVDEHNWKNGKCTLCGYTCKHEKKYTDFFSAVTITQKKDKKGNVDKKVHIATPQKEDYIQQSCANCDKIFISYKKTKKSFEVRHSFVADGDKMVCARCGYELACDHANAYDVAEVSYGSRVANTGEADTHEVIGSYSVHKLCPDCGYEFDEKEFQDGPAPHLPNKDGICQLCGYAKADAAPIALSLQKTKQLGVGETWAPWLNITPKTDAAAGVKYKSSNKKIFEVDENTGKITAKKAGKAKLTVSCGNLKASCTVTVKKAAKEIKLPKEEMTLGVGQRIALAATFSPKKTFANVSYESDNDSCVAVDPATGEIVAVAAGTAKITATAINANGTLKAECNVTVTDAPKTLSLGDVPKQMGKGEKFTILPELLNAKSELAPGYVRYASSNTKVLKVGENDGVITAAGTGTAKIYAFAYNGVQSSVQVEVKKVPKGIILTPSKTSITLNVGGDPYIVKAEIASDAAAQISWSSNKDTVAKVEPTENPGEYKITAVAAGKAKITFSTFNKKKKIITVTVK